MAGQGDDLHWGRVPDSRTVVLYYGGSSADHRFWRSAAFPLGTHEHQFANQHQVGATRFYFYRRSKMAIATINPATGKTLRSFDSLSEKDIEAPLERAMETFRSYRRMPFPERARLMIKAAEILETGSEDFGRLMTIEMGKPLRAAIEEAAKCAWACPSQSPSRRTPRRLEPFTPPAPSQLAQLSL